MGITPSARPFGAPRFARRALSFCAAVMAAGSLAACSDDNLLGAANVQNTTRVTSVWAISGTSAALPAAYKFTTESLERPQILSNGAVNFDVAFDITADGKVAFVPVRALVPLPPAGAPSVGMQRSAAGFLATTRAPERGYTDDSTAVIGVGETLVLQLRGAGCIYSDPFYAKATVDSILVAERRIVLRTLVNRNCGYRALEEGLPKN